MNPQTLSADQEKWVNHLSDTDTIKIVPYDNHVSEKFQKIEKQIKAVLGGQVLILHRGASALGISGQNEIDIYIPVSESQMDKLKIKMEKTFKLKSEYRGERIKFIEYVDGVKAEIMITNESSQSWINGETFHQYLLDHLDALEKYRLLKEEGNGISVREYYRRKILFINEILENNLKN